MISFADVEAAAERIKGAVLRSPFLRCDGLSRRTGAEIYLKLDHLQATGAFKERGAANKIALLTPAEKKSGVIAMSAGNHAQAVARHAHLAGIAATIVMPKFTPSTKITRTASWGAKVVLHGETLAESASHAHELAKTEGLVFIHPYDDLAVMAGQGTMALEMLQDQPDLDVLIVATGGGGLLSGSAIVARAMNPKLEVLGVEVENYSAFAQALAGQPISCRRPHHRRRHRGARHRPETAWKFMRAEKIEVLVVSEHAVEEAIALLVEAAKQVAEGAGAAGLAAILAFPERFR